MKNSKSNVISFMLVVVVLVSVVGFSLSIFNVDKQTMSTSINSSWSINVSSIEVEKETKTAYDLGAYISDNIIVIKPYLEGPSDSISYLITVKNNGTYDAILNKINVNYKKNDLKFEFDDIKEGDNLNKGTFKTFKLIVKYNDDIKDNRIIEPSKILIDFEYDKK